ncbi:hypothetical protein [Burkholderia sp. BC1]|uniref:hypothetical protein n=1 Tax=Burkholderia sp. BC1 TaxID=1095370 RepID=UPI004045070A
MMKNYAVVKDGIVINVIVWDGDEQSWQPPTGASAAEVPDEQAVSIGWRYDGSVFRPDALDNNS